MVEHSEYNPDNLPAFREWRSQYQPPPDANAYLSQNLDLASAVIFVKMLVPSLILRRGCVLIEDRYNSEIFEEWWLETSGNTIAIERAINHIHLWDLFDPEGDEESQALELLGEEISRLWELHAAQIFPDREFDVSVTDDYGPTIVMSSRLIGNSEDKMAGSVFPSK